MLNQRRECPWTDAVDNSTITLKRNSRFPTGLPLDKCEHGDESMGWALGLFLGMVLSLLLLGLALGLELGSILGEEEEVPNRGQSSKLD